MRVMSDTPRPTDVTTPVGSPTSKSRSGTASSVSSQYGRYLPGVVLLDRYRIVDRIGRGGMSEVYRADDLKIDQVVALKFLPRELEHDSGLLGRLLGEVRLARQVSHPNLCRVYDVEEADGRHFLTMEFVDGEDLESLLRRIGRPSQEKALEIARQVCAGLAAAHDQHILHRDLKPANIMIDGRGRARITDFGLAIADGEARGSEVHAGTPAYMAPEQWSGHEVTVRSDVYSLGLVLYELFTGLRAFDSESSRELARLHSSVTPAAPSTHVPGLDPAIERAILRCLEKDPQARPASALAVSAALPGGDPLAAALAAGETPSPELVAASGGEGALAPAQATRWLLAILFSLLAVIPLSRYSSDLGLGRPPKSPAALDERARSILAGAGVEAEPVDAVGWYQRPYAFLLHMSKQKPSPESRRGLSSWAPAVSYVYRQSPRVLAARNSTGQVTSQDPPRTISGMAAVEFLGPERLIALSIVPPQVDSAAAISAAAGEPVILVATEPDWTPLFAAAGLEPAAFTETEPVWIPEEAFDRRREWLGVAPWDPEIPLRVSAASWKGRPVSFHVRGPWVRPTLMERQASPTSRVIANVLNGVLALGVIFLGLYLAWRNVRLGRGDQRGATRLAVALTIGSLLVWALTAHHVADFGAELSIFFLGLGSALTVGAIFGGVYLAFEPYARRTVPHLLVGWARVLDGQWRDARVGRELLAGAAAGGLLAVITLLTNAVPTWIPFTEQTPLNPDMIAVTGGFNGITILLRTLVGAVPGALFLFALYVLLRILLRRDLWAVLAFLVLIPIAFGAENLVLDLPGVLIGAGLLTWMAVRHGPLALFAAQWMANSLSLLPLPLVPSAPYFVSSACVLAGLAGLGFLAYRMACGRGPTAAGAGPGGRASLAAGSSAQR
jgi:serine/threonine-protein kinase